MKSLLSAGEAINLTVQRTILGRDALAPEFAEADLSPVFKPDGTFDPSDEDYKALAKANFGGFKLTVDGLVNRPSALTLKDIRDMPSRTQITRHDCVEGWSAIGKWKGVGNRWRGSWKGSIAGRARCSRHCSTTMWRKTIRCERSTFSLTGSTSTSWALLVSSHSTRADPAIIPV